MSRERSAESYDIMRVIDDYFNIECCYKIILSNKR